MVEGPIPEISGRGVCLGQVIHVGTGMGGLPPGGTLSHEAGHCVSQSAVMGPGYLLNIVMEYLVIGYGNSYFEREATEVGQQCRIRRK